MPALKEKYSLADANTVNKMEYFAEAFRLNHEDPEGLKATAPIIYDYVNQIIARIKKTFFVFFITYFFLHIISVH